MKKIGFIGTGNMGGALAVAACKTLGADQVLVTDYDHAKAESFASENGCTTALSNEALVSGAEYIVLAVKPNVIRDVANGIRPILEKETAEGKKHVVVTIAAGVASETIRECINGCVPVVRIMPNTPAAVGEGMILITGPDAEVAEFQSLLKEAGDYLVTPEKNFDIMTAVSSCSPAYVYMFIEALADGAVQVGVSREQALLLAAKTVLGSAKMVLETGLHPEKLKDNVCSPGGSTIVGVHVLEENNFRFGVAESIIKATEKNLNLGK